MKEVWEKKARTFPRYGEYGDEDAPIFAKFEELGVKTSGKVMLDLGCGNGRYALHFAKQVRRLYALDIAQNMLNNVIADAKTHNISNITTFCSDWAEFDVANFDEPIDIVFASLTPALNSFEKFQKAYDLARECIMYIGWGRRRENRFLEAVFAAYGAKVELPVGALDVCDCLRKMGKTPPETHFITKSFTHKKSLKAAVEDANWQLEAHKVTPSESKTAEIAARFEKNGVVEYESIMEVGLMVIWK